MGDIKWAHLCDYAAIDGSGKPMIIGEFDRITSSQTPFNHLLIVVIAKFAVELGETIDYQIRLVDDVGHETVQERTIQQKISKDSPLEETSSTVVAGLGNCETNEGMHRFELRIDGRLA